MLLDKVKDGMKEVMETSEYLSDLMAPLKGIKSAAEGNGSEEVVALLEKQAQAREQALRSRQKANALSGSERKKQRQVIFFLESAGKELYLQEKMSGEEAFLFLKKRFDSQVEAMKAQTQKVKEQLHFLFLFVEEVFAEGNEMLVLVTELTVGAYSAKFIARFGSEDYQKYQKELMLSERQNDMIEQINNLEI